MSKHRKKIIIAGGGTGGHLFPAIAIGEALEKDGIEVKYIGSKNGIEASGEFIENEKIELLDLRGFIRSWSIRGIVKNILLLTKIFKSYLQVRRIIKNFKPDFIIGTGGYTCAIPLYLGIKNNIPTAIQEQNVLPGMVTRKFADKVNIIFLSFEETKKYLNKDNYLLVGNPIRAMIKEIDRTKASQDMNLDPKKKTILILGGSQGAKSINNHFIKEYKKYLDRDIQLLWQTGKNSRFELKEIDNVNIKKYEFIDRMDLAYSAVDIIVSRAGATAISEILYLGKPSILIPYPHAADNHQELNAKALEKKGASIIIHENKFNDGDLEQAIFSIIDSNEKMRFYSDNSKLYSKRDSSILIKEKLKEIMLNAR